MIQPIRFVAGRPPATDGIRQITPQMRVLVAVDAVDGRKGIDSLAALCRQKLQADPFSGWLFCVPHPQRPGDQDFVL